MYILMEMTDARGLRTAGNYDLWGTQSQKQML